jgi:nitrate reductase NapAB chaperone NapD
LGGAEKSTTLLQSLTEIIWINQFFFLYYARSNEGTIILLINSNKNTMLTERLQALRGVLQRRKRMV